MTTSFQKHKQRYELVQELTRFLDEYNLTVVEFSKVAGLSSGQVGHWQRGATLPLQSSIVKIKYGMNYFKRLHAGQPVEELEESKNSAVNIIELANNIEDMKAMLTAIYTMLSGRNDRQ